MKRRERTILHVVPWPVFGGPHNEALVYGTEALRRGWNVHVFLSTEAQESSRFTARGISASKMAQHRVRRTLSPWFWLTFPALFLLDILRLVRLMRRLRPAIVEGSSINLQPAIAARLAGARVVWRLADVSAPHAIRRLVAAVLPHLAHVILVNGAATTRAYPGMSARADVRIYYPSPDPSQFAGAPPVRMARASITVGTVANLNPDKGLEVLIDAACRLRTDTSLGWIVVGAEHETHQEYARRLRDRVTMCDLDTRFRFTGHREDVGELLATMDIFVISSHREGTTTTVLEAMALGLPVVATDVGGLSEIVDDGATGLLVPAGDSAALAAAIARLAGDATLRREYGMAGRRRYEAIFAPVVSLEARFAAYEAALRR